MMYTFASKETTLVVARLVPAGDTARVEVATSTFAANANGEAVLNAAMKALDAGATTLLFPSSLMPTTGRVLSAFRKGETKVESVLSAAQLAKFSTSYVKLLGKFATVAIEKGVRVENAQNAYRLQFGIVEVINGEEVELDENGTGVTAAGVGIQCRNFSRIIAGTYKLTADKSGNVTAARKYRLDADKVCTGKELLQAYVDGVYTPQTDSDCRNVNRLMLLAVCHAKLPKVATVARDALATA